MKRPFVQATLTGLLTVFAIVPAAIAQRGVTSSGTDFWLGFMPNGAGKGNTSVYEELFIASPTDTKVTFSGPFNKTITMTAGQVADIPLTDVMNSVDEVPQDDAIHITSTNPITVYGYSSWANPQGIGDSPDGYLALPLPAYGTEYYTVNFPDNYVFGNMPGEFLIISPYDNNIVTVTPAADTKAGRPAGVPWKDTLQKGETYLVQSPGTNFGKNDLTGTLITSTKPIAVLTGHQITSVPTDCGCFSADNLLEMIPSVDKWGTQYFDVPMTGKTIDGDYLRVLSAENGNEIIYTGNESGQHGPLLLDSGQYHDIPQQIEPMVFTSTNHKRFIVAQYSYSQGVDSDPGYSDPFLILFTPREQFEKEMIFRTPTADKGAFTNYVTFISLEDSISKITINGLPIGSYPQVGAVVFLGTNPQMGARRILIAAAPKNYIAAGPVPFGAYQYGFSNYEGYGWPTGMAQNILSTGDILPPLAQTLDSNCGTYHLRFTEPRLKSNGFSFNDTRIASVSMISASGDMRWAIPSYNYAFTRDPNFIPGDSVMTATLTVMDPAQDAYAAIDAVDLAGNDTVYQYSYGAPTLASVPTAPFEFNTILVGSDSCKRITFTNATTHAFFISNARIEGSTAGKFILSPATISRALAPGDTVQFQLCFAPSDTLSSFDTLVINSGCATLPFPLRGLGVTPIILATDLDFGSVSVGDTVCKSLVIHNIGNAPLIINRSSLSLNMPDFSFPDSTQLPDTIAAGGYMIVEICFHPQSAGPHQTTVNWGTNLAGAFIHQRKDTSSLTGIGVSANVNSVPQSIPFSLSISPNPTSSLSTISITGAPSANVEIFDILGREVASFRVVGSYELQMNGLTPGTYIVRAEASGAVVSKPLLKQ